MNFQIERLKQIPQQKNDVWQGGLTRLPMWTQDESLKPYRPWMASWISLKTKLVYLTEPKARKKIDFETVLQSLANFACDKNLAGYLPGKIQVKDSTLAKYLGDLLAEINIVVEQQNKLFTFDEMIVQMAEELGSGQLLSGALSVKGITVESMHAFADAASEFYQAQPWQYLMSEDIVEVESPFVDAGLRYFSVLGAGGNTFGIGFYDSIQQFEAIFEQNEPDELNTNSHWALLFGPITELPFEDADLWEDYNFPVASEEAYPAAMCFVPGKKHRRPGPDILTFLEGMLRAMAQTTEEQIDSGRWKKHVTTSKGEIDFTFSLPDLLEPEENDSPKKIKMSGGVPDRRNMERLQADINRVIEGHDFSNIDEMNEFLNENLVGKEVPRQVDMTPLEQAQNLIYDAFDVRGRKELQLARKALGICPDCADAYVLLAERCSDIKKAQDFYMQGVAAGERVLGEEFFEKEAGNFWGILETRPYMRARIGLAQCLTELGQIEEAAQHYRELLRLNPNDNQGARDFLLICLLEMNENDEAEQLLKKYEADKHMAFGSYAQALLTFRKKGDNVTARNNLKKALDINKYVPRYLLGDEAFPPIVPAGFSIGSEEEAVICADMLIDAWNETPRAIEWLESQT